MKYFLTLFILFFTISSCKDNDENIDFDTQNETEIIDYLNENNLEATKSSTGLYYIIQEQGEGDFPDSDSTVTVKYKGYFINGKTFDQSNQDGITFNLQQVIAGWTEGITYFREGGKGMLLIPSKLGYGPTSRNGIPGGSVLIFDIELLDVK
ncbi:MAG: FKBP-type peptidyl-prolyl cis-trans isomerase [Flavobacteriaceae bacterium]|nr:FKBP-type peptidyl-prolyl cis-trans isomerase [Flavobacteriaceae bacterium]